MRQVRADDPAKWRAIRRKLDGHQYGRELPLQIEIPAYENYIRQMVLLETIDIFETDLHHY